MKIARYMMVIVSVLLLGLLVNTGCKKGAQVEPADLGDMESPAADVPDEGAGFAITDVKLVLPNQEEVGVDSKRISRHAKIKVIYEGELGSDIEFMLDGNPVAHTVLSNENGELLLKPNMPMHNLKGYTILGQPFKVKAPGDINGDGLSDFIVGAPDFDDGTNKGAAFVFFGNPDNAYPSSYQGANVKIYGSPVDAQLGSSVALGDLNGDGYDDIVVGAPNALEQGVPHGSVIVIYGREDIAGNFYAGQAQFDFYVHRASGSPSNLGSSLAVGDVNGDGLEDVIIGEYLAEGKYNDLVPDQEDYGAVHVIFGKTRELGPAIIFDGQQPVEGTVSFDDPASPRFKKHVGESVAAADVNGDGIDDIIVGAPGKVGANSGKVYILLGKNGLESSSYVAVDATLEQQGIDRFGVSVAAASEGSGDIVLIGAMASAYKYSPATDKQLIEGSIFLPGEWIVSSIGDGIGIGYPSGDRVFRLDNNWDALPALSGDSGSEFGCAISPAGDLNGDGQPDYLIGASKQMFSVQLPNQGAVWINADTGMMIFGRMQSHFGTAVAGGRIR